MRTISIAVIDDYGSTWYYLYEGGPLHRADGPAVEHIDGGVEYWFNGGLQSVVGLVITENGDREWYHYIENLDLRSKA